MLTWNHLWYLAYLIVYTFILAAIYPLVKRIGVSGETPINRSPWLYSAVAIIPVITFALHENWLEDVFPSTHALMDDWGNHLLYFPFILFAFLGAKSKRVWQIIDRLFVPACVAGVLLAIWQLFVWSLTANDLGSVPYIEVWAILHSMAEPIYAWACILVAFGLTRRFANRPSLALTYMTEAIFPWYILHQTFIVMAGFWFTRIGIPAVPEFILVTLATTFGCLLTHELLIRRSRVLRPLFGLKNSSRKQVSTLKTEASRAS